MMDIKKPGVLPVQRGTTRDQARLTSASTPSCVGYSLDCACVTDHPNRDFYNAGFADVVDKVDVADFVFPRGGEAPGGVPLNLLLCARRYVH